MRTDVGRTSFQDGMRVAREHLDHLQEVLLGAADLGRQLAGLGKVCFGLRVKLMDPDHVAIEAGVAFDRAARVLAVAQQDVALKWDADTLYLVLKHVLRADEASEFNGDPTIYHDDAEVDVRHVSPPYDDDAVLFARLDRRGETVEVTQLGAWYLTAQDHAHSGQFVVSEGVWRYDGDPLGYPPARFDTGFVPVGRGETVTLKHGLRERDLLVQLQARREDGVVTSAGVGTTYWHELTQAAEVRLLCSKQADEGLELRAMIWPLDASAGGPLLPLANPGPAVAVEPNTSFKLDAGRSRAFGGRQVAKYIWTEID